MSMHSVSFNDDCLVGKSSFWVRLFTLGAIYDFLSIDTRARTIESVECRFWRKHEYSYAFDEIECGAIEVVSSASSTCPKSGVEMESYGMALSLYQRLDGFWFDLCRFTCNRTITPDILAFLFGWIFGLRRDQLDGGMETAKTVADFLARKAGIPVRFPTYTAQSVYRYVE